MEGYDRHAEDRSDQGAQRSNTMHVLFATKAFKQPDLVVDGRHGHGQAIQAGKHQLSRQHGLPIVIGTGLQSTQHLAPPPGKTEKGSEQRRIREESFNTIKTSMSTSS